MPIYNLKNLQRVDYRYHAPFISNWCAFPNNSEILLYNHSIVIKIKKLHIDIVLLSTTTIPIQISFIVPINSFISNFFPGPGYKIIHLVILCI